MSKPKSVTLRAWLREQRGRLTWLASRLHVTTSLVSMYANRQRRVPAERCMSIQHLTAETVQARTLRPDIFGSKS